MQVEDCEYSPATAHQPSRRRQGLQRPDCGFSSATATATLSITVLSPLLITTTSLPSEIATASYNATLIATGGKPPYTWNLVSGRLPAGLSLDANSGTIIGTASAGGTSNFTVRVGDSGAFVATATANFSITVLNPLSVTTTSLPTGTVNVPYAGTLVATGGQPPYTWNIVSGSLPVGLSLNTSSGAITGTATTGGTSNFTVRVADAEPFAATATESLSITLNQGVANGSGDHTPPTITITAPTPATFINQSTPQINVGYQDAVGTGENSASGIDTSTLRIALDGADITGGLFSVGATTASAHIATALLQGTHNLTAAIKDIAGNLGQTSAGFTVDLTSPTISVTASPTANLSGWNNTNVTVTFNCSDSLSGIASCAAPVPISTEGVRQGVSGTATDLAGNTATASLSVSIDKTQPTIAATQSPAPNSAGWNNSDVTVSFVCSDSLSGIATCPSSVAVTTEGANQTVSAQASDQAGNTAVGGVSLNIDKTPPNIISLVTPDQIMLTQPAQITVNVTDNLTVALVTIAVNGATLGSFSLPPYQTTFTAPPGSKPGDTLTVTATAVDAAGNSTGASRGVVVADNGVLVGTVLSDVTGLPISGASLLVAGHSDQADVSDYEGRYAIEVTDAHLFLQASQLAKTGNNLLVVPVEREVAVQSGAGTVPVDARLTPLASAVVIDSTGGSLSATAFSVGVAITIAPGAVSGPTSFHLTPLSGQGLPNLLPLGWSPVAAFDWRSDSTSASAAASFTGLPQISLHLVTYDTVTHGWLMVAPNLIPASDGTLAVNLPSTNSYALVVPDVGSSIIVPGPGQPLPGVAMVALAPDAASTGTLTPIALGPGGGTAQAILTVQSSTPAPSGTVIQSSLSEDYSLTSGDKIFEQSRSQDIVLYQFGAPTGSILAAQLPVTPSHTFQPAQLVSGEVILDILAGREGVRGQAGGSDAVVVQSGSITLTVAAGSLPQNTAISVTSAVLDSFLPTSGSATPITEVTIDFSGQTLTTPAQLSVDGTGVRLPTISSSPTWCA